MSFHCAHAGFTAAVNHPTSGYLGQGNVMSDCQSSTYVRAKLQTRCNGHDFAVGRLRDFDLDFFGRALPHAVRVAALTETQTRDIILYRFFHWRSGQRQEHGWLMTNRDHRMLRVFVTGPTWKSRDAVMRAADLITGQ